MLVDGWREVLTNLDLLHRNHIVGKEMIPRGTKDNFVTHGIKYKLYEMRNLIALRGLRPYWHSTTPRRIGGAEATAEDASLPRPSPIVLKASNVDSQPSLSDSLARCTSDNVHASGTLITSSMTTRKHG